MNFKWTTNDSVACIVSLYSTNITLNKVACRYFQDINYVLLGIDEENHCLGIKPISKDAIDYYEKDQLFKLSLGKSYGRITNKTFVNDFASLIKIDFAQQSCVKFKAEFDEKQKVLIIDYKGGLL